MSGGASERGGATAVDKEKPLPRYSEPPVIEVACGVIFEPLHNLLVPHFGLLWERFRDEYTQCREVPPLTAAIESLEQAGAQRLRFEFGSLPPLPRIWFQHKSGSGLIQLQRDRFHYNWQKREPSDSYPHYESVVERFKKHLEQVEAFLRDHGLAEIRPVQYEMTYINHLELTGPLATIGGAGSVFPDFGWRNTKARFLPVPEAINWETIFLLPNKSGRLHVTINNGIRLSDKKPVINLEVTARGIPSESPKEKIWQWFGLAHEWIVRGFTDITSDDVHTVWKRVQ
jgi:uncharacterized protein (TIGR04255 family)